MIRFISQFYTNTDNPEHIKYGLRLISNEILNNNQDIHYKRHYLPSFNPFFCSAKLLWALEYLYGIIAEYGLSNKLITLEDILPKNPGVSCLMIEGVLRFFVVYIQFKSEMWKKNGTIFTCYVFKLYLDIKNSE